MRTLHARWLAPWGLAALPWFGTRSMAADQDDIYLAVMAGHRFDSEQRFQGSLVAGYCPVDSLGVGVGLEQSAAYQAPAKAGRYRYGTRVFGEARWFLEPVEASVGAGWRRLANNEGAAQGSLVMQASSAYLVALTTSLAAKFEFQAQYAWGRAEIDRWSGSVGAGLRLIY